MQGSEDACPEDVCSTLLAVIFELASAVALGIANQAACQVATYAADLGATLSHVHALELALEQIADLHNVLDTPSTPIEESKRLKDGTTIH